MSDFALSKVSGSDDWATPVALYADLDREFQFDDDPCPLKGKALQDGLSRPWGKSVFMNPPYSNPEPWCKRAFEEAGRGAIVVGLLRSDTSTGWFHRWVLGKAELRFVKGRLHFNDGGSAPFASLIAVWRPRAAGVPGGGKQCEAA